ncbi:MAG: arsenate reductase (glutaredoxin) [Sphingobacteriales bacterium]|nr:MAG: arsenate reductase (glutaredoxin) [Sphingobacteriales bacterium]
MTGIIIYHNGECSKCRGALEILQEKGIPHDVRWYLSDPLSEHELRALLDKLKMKPSDIIRKGEPVYKDQYEGKELSEEEWLQALLDNPILMERPIVEKGEVAIVARPPEKVLEMI